MTGPSDWRRARAPSVPGDRRADPLIRPRRTGPGCSFASTIDPDVLGEDSRQQRGAVLRRLPRRHPRPRHLPSRATAWPCPVHAGPSPANATRSANVVAKGWLPLPFRIRKRLLQRLAERVQRPGRPVLRWAARAHTSTGRATACGPDVLAARPCSTAPATAWVGPGHNSVFRDFGGQWWTMYHAVDLFRVLRRPPGLHPEAGAAGPAGLGEWLAERALGPGPRRHRSPVPRPSLASSPGTGLPQAPTDLTARNRHRRKPPTSSTGTAWIPPGPGCQSRMRARTASPARRWSCRPAVATSPVRAGGRFSPGPRLPVTTWWRPRCGSMFPAPAGMSGHVRAGLVMYADDDRFVSLVHGAPGTIRVTELSKKYQR